MPTHHPWSALPRRSLCTPELLAIWSLELLNYSVHVLSRPQPWNEISQAIGYALWAIQLFSFAALQLADFGSVPLAWEERAASGAERDVSVDGRTGRLVPPRARYVKRVDAVVCGLDHFCHWLGTPIGFANRKLFILFVGYSALFCVVGSAHSLAELLWYAPARLNPPPPSMPHALWAAADNVLQTIDRASAAARLRNAGSIMLAVGSAAWVWVFELVVRASDAGQLLYITSLLATALLNPIAGLLLTLLTTHQVLLVLMNRTTLAPDDTRYDVGLYANWVQVFGPSPLLWLVPTTRGAAAPVGDGLHFAESERWAQQQQRSAEIRKRHAEAAADPTAAALSARLHIDPSEHVPPPQGYPKARWALGHHQQGRLGSSSLVRISLSSFERVKAVARAWEERLFCGLMAIGSLRLAHKLVQRCFTTAAARTSHGTSAPVETRRSKKDE